jgi:ribulose-5-phosphate 4-epimerase/fuculose-1-phosphate aldolase
MKESQNPASVQPQVTATEWQLRVDLAAFLRMVAEYGWDDLLLAHISARLPDENAYLVNPYGLLFGEITASSLLKVDFAGRKLLPSDYEISPEANVIHGALLEARPDVNCVAHVHTIAGMAVSNQKAGLLNISQQSMLVAASLAYHDYQGIVLDPAEAPSLQADLGDKQHMILRNHGLLTVGATVSRAFYALYNLQRSCEMQVASQGHGAELIPITDAAMERTRQLIQKISAAPQKRDLLWEAKLRQLRSTSPEFEQ